MRKTAQLGGLLLAFLAALVLLWLWLRDENASATAAPDQREAKGVAGAALEDVAPGVADPALLRTTAPDPAIPAVDEPAAEQQDAAEIAGRLIFSGGDDYPLPFSRVQVITDAPVIGEDVPQLAADELGSRVLYLIPVGDDGRFSFRIPASLGTADVSAVGPSCVATRDVTITIGTPQTIPMVFFYCGAVSLRDADSGALLDEVTNLYLESGGIAFRPDKGATTGVRSTLALLRIKRQLPRVDNLSIFRQFLTSPKFCEKGLPFKVSARMPGFEPLDAEVAIPGYSGELPIQLVSLQSGANVRCNVALTIKRPGDWSGTEFCDYFGTGRFTVSSEDPASDRLSTSPVLRPGLLTLRGIPFPDPRLWYEAEADVRAQDSPKPFQISLAPPASSGDPSTGELVISDCAAFYLPPRMGTAGEFAYFGHIRHSDEKPGWRRYSVRKGLILDGLRLDRYRVFWAESYGDIKQRMAGNLAFADLTLVPGLNRLPSPP